MKITSRIILLALLALLVAMTGCGKKDDADTKNAAGATKTDGATEKETGKSSVGGFGK